MLIKSIILSAVLVIGLRAETVFLSANGKTFHKTAKCMTLARVKHMREADRAEAVSHGLKECGICYRQVDPTKAAKGPAVKNAWAAEVISK